MAAADHEEPAGERPGRAARVRRLLLTPEAGVVAIVLVFLAISAWWLSRDLRIVNPDNAKHINIALQWYLALEAGNPGEPLRIYNVYPPGTHIVGALGAFLFGFKVPGVAMAQNLVFVPLLALGCYGTARIAFGRRAGLLAAAFALGTPMVISMFHQSLPDVPMAAMVAVTVWLLLASDRFSRVGLAAAAGLAAGLGMYTKSTFVLFVVGIVAMLFLRGGWRNWRGVLVFVAVAGAVTAPYYLDQFTAIEAQATGHLTSPLPIWYDGLPYPGRGSIDNYTWYFWSLINNQLYLPLALFFFAGAVWALRRVVRAPRDSGYLPELLVGGFVGYLAVSMLVLKDPRYTLPCLVYVAVLATGWIGQLGRRARVAASVALAAIVVFNTAALNLGVGGVHSINLPNAVQSPIGEYAFQLANEHGYFAGPPRRQGEPLVKLLDGLADAGAKDVIFDEQTFGSDGYHLTGLVLLSLQSRADLPAFTPEHVRGRDTAWVVRADVEAVGRRPCLMSPLADDGTGIYVYRGRVPQDMTRATPDCP
ncbi:MAG: glycosyltransferase family 39 protein [Solirubrobacteraceae bacterium]|nr:glycosyltransferase family 39 protein [Solirubrobacteraceae bacterium]